MTMRNRSTGSRQRLGIVVLAAAAAAGCLQKDTTHTLYLSPVGRLSWLAIEKDVRSDDTDPVRRFAEEQAYIAAAAGGVHGVGRGLAALDPTRLRTRAIRNERPFIVVTEAEFSSLEFAVQRFLVQLRAPGDVRVTGDGATTTLRVRIDAFAANAGDDGPETDVVELVEDLDRYRIVLTAGRFTSATGFTLTDGATVAVPVTTPWETIVANGGVLELSLTWTR
jgi:hypothetical protein